MLLESMAKSSKVVPFVSSVLIFTLSFALIGNVAGFEQTVLLLLLLLPFPWIKEKLSPVPTSACSMVCRFS